MSEDQFNAFLAAAAADANVRSALEAASSPAEIVHIAASLGHEVTIEDIDPYAAKDGELSDAELEGAAGGTALTFTPRLSVSVCGG